MTIHAVPMPELPGDVYEDPAVTSAADGQARARREGHDFDEIAYLRLEHAGATFLKHRHQIAGVIPVDALVQGHNGNTFRVLANGVVDTHTSSKLPGLRRTDTIRKIISSVMLLAQETHPVPVLILTSHLPEKRDRAAGEWLTKMRPYVFDVISINSGLSEFHRLQRYLCDTPAPTEPEPADWAAPSWHQMTLDGTPDWGSDA